jgi:hypothetical protein
MIQGRFASRVLSLPLRGFMGILVLAAPLTLAACDGDSPVAVNMIGEPLLVPGVPFPSCQVTVTAVNGLDVALSELQVSYGYMADSDNKDQLVALTFENIAPDGKVRVQKAIAQDACAAVNFLKQPIVSACRTDGGKDCRSQAVLSQDGVPIAYK